MTNPTRPTLAQEASALVDELDRRAAAAGEGVRHARLTERFPYRRETKLQQRHADGSLIDTWTYTHDLSIGGLGCLHTKALPVGTPVQVSLMVAGSDLEGVLAKVVYCQRIRGDWYSVGLKFDHPIDPQRYLNV